MRILACCVALLAIARVAAAQPEPQRQAPPAPGGGITFEYQRVYATGEETSFRLEESGRITGSVRTITDPAGAERTACGGWLTSDRVRRHFGDAALWSAAAPGVLPQGKAGVRISATRQAGGAGGPALQLACEEKDVPSAVEAGLPALEVLSGAGALLAEAWYRKGVDHERSGRWSEAAVAYRRGLERVPALGRYCNEGAETVAAAHSAAGRHPEAAAAWKEELERRIALARETVRGETLARCFPDGPLWPKVGRPAWPWDWAQPDSGWQETRLTRNGAPTIGLRYARPPSWPRPVDVAPTDEAARVVAGAEALGVQALPAAGGTSPAAGRLELVVAEVAADLSLQARIEESLEARKATALWSKQYRRRSLHVTDVLALAGESAERWFAVQSGAHVVVARASWDPRASATLAGPLARLLASLEPLPAAPASAPATVEPMQSVLATGMGGLHFPVPAGWVEEKPAEPVRGVFFREYLPPGAAPRFRLAVRAYGKVEGDAPNRYQPIWTSLPHPTRKDVMAGSGDAGAVFAQVMSAVGLARLQSGTFDFGGEVLPVYTLFLGYGDQHEGGGASWGMLEIALVCPAGDPAALAAGRVLIEKIAGGLQ